MSPIFTYNGKILQKDGKLANNINCCCGRECPAPTTGGLNDTTNFGWTKPLTKNANSITATFKFENGGTPGCGGTNYDRQFGSGSCNFTLNENKLVTLQVNGNTEDQNPGYDYGWIIIDGPGVPETNTDPHRGKAYHVLISSTQYNQLCTMFAKNDQRQFNLGPGVYIVTFQVDTIDGEWHKDMVHNFSVSWD